MPPSLATLDITDVARVDPVFGGDILLRAGTRSYRPHVILSKARKVILGPPPVACLHLVGGPAAILTRPVALEASARLGVAGTQVPGDGHGRLAAVAVANPLRMRPTSGYAEPRSHQSAKAHTRKIKMRHRSKANTLWGAGLCVS